jgi:hypothetical protein
MFPFKRHNCVAELQRQGWQVFDPDGWREHQESLAAIADELVAGANRGLTAHSLAAGAIGAFYDELGRERADKLWRRLCPGLRLPYNGRDAARTARRLLLILCEE